MYIINYIFYLIKIMHENAFSLNENILFKISKERRCDLTGMNNRLTVCININNI